MATRHLAHRLTDELRPPRPPIVRDTWRDHARDAAEIIVGTIVVGALFLGILLVLFLAGGSPA